MLISALLKKVIIAPETISFDETITVIDNNYTFKETVFTNGEIRNEAGENNGSCKIFAFGHLNNLTEEQTLNCFGDYYRSDVLGKPDDDNHHNIRNFIKQGWQGISFDGEALVLK